MLKTYLPQSTFLKKYVASFYVLKTNDLAVQSYFAFPHFFTGITFLKDVEVERKPFQILFKESPENGAHVELLGKYKTPVFVSYSGRISEVTIIFKPLGINRFIRSNYFSVAPSFAQEFTNKIWKEFGNELFKSEDPISSLEAFLIEQFEDFEEISVLDKALPFFENLDENISIADIAKHVGLNLKSFQRHFIKHLGCTPVDYRRLVRFRNSLASKLISKEEKSMTEITFENNYFDQSYFIKEFKNFTNQNPSKFFKRVSLVDGEKIIWEIF